MRAFCGAVEVTPIHPLKIAQQVTGTETLYEGLAVFDPGALTPSCDSVKLMVYSEKDPQKADTLHRRCPDRRSDLAGLRCLPLTRRASIPQRT